VSIVFGGQKIDKMRIIVLTKITKTGIMITMHF